MSDLVVTQPFTILYMYNNNEEFMIYTSCFCFQSHVSYSGGYQTRGKKKKDTEADDEGGRKLTSKSSKEEPKISKHQKKKVHTVIDFG